METHQWLQIQELVINLSLGIQHGRKKNQKVFSFFLSKELFFFFFLISLFFCVLCTLNKFFLLTFLSSFQMYVCVCCFAFLFQ